MLVSVSLYDLEPTGRRLVATDFLEADECHACHGTRRFTAAHPALAFTVACPFCWRRSP